jgi:hypothetical protein
MLEKSAQAGEGGGHAFPLHVQVVVYAPAERADALRLFLLYHYMYSVVDSKHIATDDCFDWENIYSIKILRKKVSEPDYHYFYKHKCE